MKVLMLGWEFPPNNHGGLGTACEGLVQSMTAQGIGVQLVLPQAQASRIPGCTILSPDLSVTRVASALQGYSTPQSYHQKSSIYGNNLFAEVQRYAQAIIEVTQGKDFDVIHAHDWLTYGAGLALQKKTKKPLVVHVHATEFDRSGGAGVHQAVYELEKEGMASADYVVTVSKFTAKMVMRHYGISEKKIRVVHNGVRFTQSVLPVKPKKAGKYVLFLGRLTLQKGPDYFLQAARLVLAHRPNTIFVVAGSGDMEPHLIETVAAWGLGDQILFTGYLRGAEVDKMYQLSDLYVMPSVSEPFGITPLEAMRNNIPVIISKQSGVSEVIDHCLQVDFWDIRALAAKMISVLDYPTMCTTMTSHAYTQAKNLNWDKPAALCKQIYQEALC